MNYLTELTPTQREQAIRIKLTSLGFDAIESDSSKSILINSADYCVVLDYYFDADIQLLDLLPRDGLTLETELLIYETARVLSIHDWIAWDECGHCFAYTKQPMKDVEMFNGFDSMELPLLHNRFDGDWKDSVVNLCEYREVKLNVID